MRQAKCIKRFSRGRVIISVKCCSGVSTMRADCSTMEVVGDLDEQLLQSNDKC